MEKNDFGYAIRLIKSGEKAARHGWCNDGMYIWLLPEATIPAEWCRDPVLRSAAHGAGGEILALGSIRIKTANGSILTGWLPSLQDILADDWIWVE